MEPKQNKINRRNFLKTVTATSLGSVFASAHAKAEPNEPNTTQKTQKPDLPHMPKRKLGKTGIEVPCLALGGEFNFVDNQIMLRKSLEWGVSYWDTAHWYAGGNSEVGIGKFLSKNPDVRKNVFIATKASGAKNVADVDRLLATSFKRMNTDYIDLYYGIHMLSDPAMLNDELKSWAQNAKRQKLIRYFGFSTHKNMAQCLAAAAKLDWIDAIMTSYNFRVMQDPNMPAAIEAAHKAGIALIAMKTQGRPVWEIKSEADKWQLTEAEKKLTEQFLKRGFTEAQANIKIVLNDRRFASVCVGMTNVAHLVENVAASLDKTKMTKADFDAFAEYARATCTGYCAGCAHICDAALPETPYVSEIMRYLMYYNSYGDTDRAKKLFAQIPAGIKTRLLTADFTTAERQCPNHLPIAKLITLAVEKLA